MPFIPAPAGPTLVAEFNKITKLTKQSQNRVSTVQPPTYTPGMASQGVIRFKVALIVVLALLSVAIAAGAVVAGIVESNKKPVKAGATVSKATVEARVVPVTPSRSPTPEPTAAPLPARSPTAQAPVPVATAPPVRETVQAPVPAPVPAPVRRQCPTGSVTAHLTSVTFDMATPSSSLTEVTITGRGVLTNNTNSPIGVGEDDIPNFQGLDVRGQSIVIELYGTYDWAPAPGQPSMGEFVLEPGASVAYTAVSKTWDTTVKDVRFWYSATVPGSMLLYFPGRDVVCPVPGMTPADGKAIPNTFSGVG